MAQNDGSLSPHRVGFPAFNNYNLALKYFCEQGLQTGFVLPPAQTRKTIHYGELNSPDYVCAPFKHLTGSMIELLECGADILVETGGPCRLGFYGELQDKILHDLGYEFTMINLDIYRACKKREWLKLMRFINPDYKIPVMLREAANAIKMAEYLDDIEALYHKNLGFEVNEGDHDRVEREFLLDMKTAESGADIRAGYKKARSAMEALPLDKPPFPLRVGLVGEYYTVMDSFSNLDLENKLCRLGVEVYRNMNLTNYNLHPSELKLRASAKDYMRYDMGPTSAATVGAAVDYARLGFDGIVHVKSFGCTPEVDVMPLLQRVSADYKIPVLYLSYDTQTGDAGLETRVEAFYDMIARKKKVLKN